MEPKLKHLEIIQGVINRLSTNSFLLKGWSVVLVSAFLALAAHRPSTGFAYLACIPAFVFWGLDGYFLSQERLYRALFDHVRVLPPNDVDFSMNAQQFGGSRYRLWLRALASPTLMVFHGALIVAIAGVVAVSLTNGG